MRFYFFLAKLNFSFCIQEVSLKEEMLEKMEKDLETYKRKFSVMIHQQVG